MTKVNDGGPAFLTEPNTQPGFYKHHGMTLRDWFAGQAVTAVIRQCANDLGINNPDKLTPEQYFAMKAYAVADAMLAERAKGEVG